MATSPKVKYGLKNLYVAKLTIADDGTYSFGTPKWFPGARSLSLEAQGENEPYYADDGVYYRAITNNGYSGDLTVALVHDWFRQEYLGETLTTKGVLVENTNNSEPVYFALLCEFDNDAKAARRVFYKCSASRPSEGSQTTEGSKSPGEETLSITADPLPDGMVRAKTTADIDATVYSGWYTTVHVPTAEELAGTTTSGD